jgi:PAS domain S-box-containing protein
MTAMIDPSAAADYRAYVRGQIRSLMETLTRVMFGDFTAVAQTHEADEDFGNLCAMINVAINAARNAQDDLRRANEHLQRSETYLAEAQRLSHTGSWAYNPAKHKPVYWSAEMFRVCGFDPQQVPPTGDAFLERVPPEDRKRVHEVFYNAMQEKTEYEDEHRIILPDGTIKHIHSIGHPVLNRSGNVVEFVGSAVDVTERRRAEQSLRLSESYLAQAQRLAHIGSWVWDAAGRDAVYVSEEWCRIFGFDPKDGMPSWEQRLQRVHPEDRSRFQLTIDRAVTEKSNYDLEFRILPPQAPGRYIHSVGRPILSSSGELVQFVGVSMDVTESKQAEQERERLHQLEADLARLNRVGMMGELAASLAHEIKQPISAASLDADTCSEWLAHNEPNIEEARQAASRIIQDVTRASEIIDRVRALYKKGELHREALDVNEIIREMIGLLRSDAGRKSISIRTELADSLPLICADRVQLQQVFMNLALNAIDAIKDSNTPGTLTIKSQLDSGGALLVSVSDTGVGLPRDQTGKIFDAFFTTKSQGTGMGLSISRSIVESHGGRLWAADNSPCGAIFFLTLPPHAQTHG